MIVGSNRVIWRHLHKGYGKIPRFVESSYALVPPPV